MKNFFDSWKILIIIGFFTCILLVAFAGVIFYWMVYPYNPVTIHNITTITKEVEAGGTFRYDISYCKHLSMPALANRKFVDGLVFNLPPITLKNSVGCKIDHVALDVPKFFEGEYHHEVLLEYQVNPIRKVHVKFQTENFKVIKKDE